VERSVRRPLAVVLAAGSLALGLSAPARDLGTLPAGWALATGEAARLPWSAWLPLSVRASQGLRLTWAPVQGAWRVRAGAPGWYQVQLRWLGWVPFRSLVVHVAPPARVVPGGQSVGVTAETAGLLVLGWDPVPTAAGIQDPAQAAGIRAGDLLSLAGGGRTAGWSEWRQAVARAGARHQALVVWDHRGDRTMRLKVRSVFDIFRRTWTIGVRLAHTASGLGTLSFWLPGSLRYAALGHSLRDTAAGRPVPVLGGQVVGATVVGVIPSAPDNPGEKVGVLTGAAGVFGAVSANGPFGVVGRLAGPPRVGWARPVPVALPDEVRPGRAELLTVVRGLAPEAFPVQILRAYPQTRPAPRGILFQVTGRRLLAEAGGIVQGMSGSPLLQNGRLVGVVTHVVVANPVYGYGSYAAWVYDALVPPRASRPPAPETQV
jgi:stage IV sporulation protein B